VLGLVDRFYVFFWTAGIYRMGGVIGFGFKLAISHSKTVLHSLHGITHLIDFFIRSNLYIGFEIAVDAILHSFVQLFDRLDQAFSEKAGDESKHGYKSNYPANCYFFDWADH
jgi:hypothetical protein